MSRMATTMFDVICLATGDTKHLYHAYLGCIWFKSLHPQALHALGHRNLNQIIPRRCGITYISYSNFRVGDYYIYMKRIHKHFTIHYPSHDSLKSMRWLQVAALTIPIKQLTPFVWLICLLIQQLIGFTHNG